MEMSSEAKGAARTVAITRRGADRLRAGHVWVYRSDLQLSEGSGSTEQPERGDLVTVVDGRGIALGTALYSAGSQIALRMVSQVAGLARADYLRDVRSRVTKAIALRGELAPLSAGDDARRLVFGEADGLPGIVADQYGDLVVVQLALQGTARGDVRTAVGEALPAAFGGGAGTIWERMDSRIREIEGLAAGSEAALWTSGEEKTRTIFHVNGLAFHYDASGGQKTGAFLDQRLNYAAAERYGRGRALDICTYHGGFALHLARTCDQVTGVDASRAALEIADQNLQLNGGAIRAGVEWIEADAFELLRGYEEAGKRFEMTVLDPPAFAKTKRAAEGALRGYKELNLRAMRMLAEGGTLVTCSCSHHVSREEFLSMLQSCASDVRRRVQVLEVRGAAPDHPAVLTLPETSYLKCVICRVG